MSKINIMSLGGLNENGKNLYVVSVDSKLLIFEYWIELLTNELKIRCPLV